MADRFFYRLGYRVAFRPKSTVFVALLAVFLCCLGFMNLTIEADGEVGLLTACNHVWFGKLEHEHETTHMRSESPTNMFAPWFELICGHVKRTPSVLVAVMAPPPVLLVQLLVPPFPGVLCC